MLATAVSAQGTPTPTSESHQPWPAVGDSVTLPAPPGSGIAVLTVLQISGPLPDMPPTFRGNRWFGVEYQLTNPSAMTASFSWNSLKVIDSEGFVYTPGSAFTSPEAYPRFPELNTINAGTVLRGWLLYELPEPTTPAWVVSYPDTRPYSDIRLVIAARAPRTNPDDSGEVPVFDITATRTGALRIDAIIPDLPADPLSMGRAEVTVGIQITAISESDEHRQPVASRFKVVDELGIQYQAEGQDRDPSDVEAEPPAFSNDPLPAGSSVVGIVPFVMPAGATISLVVYEPPLDSDTASQLLILPFPPPGSPDYPTPAYEPGPGFPRGDCDPRSAPVTSPTPATGLGACVPLLGETIPVFDESGAEVARIAALEVLDPISVSNPSWAPRGTHLAAVRYQVTNTGARPYSLNLEPIRLIDQEGFVHPRERVALDDENTARYPALPDSLRPGERGEGWLFYRVADGATIATVVWRSEFQFATVAALREQRPPRPEATLLDGMLRPSGTLTIDRIESGVTDPAFFLEPGFALVRVTWTLANNTGARIAPISQASMLVDQDGRIHLPARQMNASDRTALAYVPAQTTVSGELVFHVPVDTSAAFVLFTPGSQLYVLGMPTVAAHTFHGEGSPQRAPAS